MYISDYDRETHDGHRRALERVPKPDSAGRTDCLHCDVHHAIPIRLSFHLLRFLRSSSVLVLHSQNYPKYSAPSKEESQLNFECESTVRK